MLQDLAILRRSRIAVAALCCLLGWGHVSATSSDGFAVQDPHYGEVLFHFYQQDYFTALTHLAAYRTQGRVNSHMTDAELLQGGLMLSWGQHEEAGKIFERLLADSEDPAVRNRTWFYLAKVRYQRGYIEAAQQAFENITAPLPEELEAERYNLLARIYMDQGRFADAAALLTNWDGTAIWTAYARYNLGVAMVRMNELDAGAALLNKVGTMRIGDADREELLGLRDRANVALGFAYLQADLQGEAKPVLQRVRLNGPFSNKALLGVGWADSAKQNYRQALVPWMELSEREMLDSAVQESLLAVPYAMAQLSADELSAQYYASALQIFDAEIQRLDRAIVDAGGGKLVNALLASDDSLTGGWYWQLDEIPDDDRTRYLYFAIADHRFHEGLKSYRDLIALNRNLHEWAGKLDTYADMLDTRELAYAARLPAATSKIADTSLTDMRREYETLLARTAIARSTHDVVNFATTAEQEQWQRLLELEKNPAWAAAESHDLRAKQRILKGLLLWQMEKEFRVRAWRHQRDLKKLAGEIERAEASFAALQISKDSIPDTVTDFDLRITKLHPRIAGMQSQLRVAMDNHADYLHQLAQAELKDQQQRLLTYRAQARFALASIYDRMSAKAD